MKPPYPCYLFDLDGTLVDSAPDIACALNHALEEYGFAPAPESLAREWIGQGSRVLLRKAFASAGAEPPALGEDGFPEPALQLFLSYYEQHIANHSGVYPGVRETLHTLHERGAALGVVTNKFLRLADPLLEQLDLRRLMSAIIGPECASARKPAAAPVELACARMHTDPAESMMVGDSIIDQGAAVAAGCAAYRQVNYGYKAPPEPGSPSLPEPTYIASLAELLTA